MKKLFSSILLFAACAAGMVSMQSCSYEDEYMYGKGLYTIDWSAAADSATTQLVNHYWSSDRNVFCAVNDDWDFTTSVDYSYWPQAHAMDVIIDAYKRTGDQKYKDMFAKWFEGVKRCNWADRKGYCGEYYDDSAWIGLTIMRLYETTNDQKYLDAAKVIWKYLQDGWDEENGGGIYWATSHKSDKNSCTMGPSAILGAKIYNATKDQKDLEWAQKIYDWEYEYLYNPANGRVYGGLKSPEMVLSSESPLSYNQGTFAGAAYELYKITGDVTYLNTARKVCYFGISSSSILDTGNNIIRDEGYDHNNPLFKGIFMRYFVQVILEKDLDPVYKNKFVTFLNNNADVLWRKGVIKNDLQMFFNSNWAQPIQGTSAYMECQVAGCTLLEARALYEKNK